MNIKKVLVTVVAVCFLFSIPAFAGDNNSVGFGSNDGIMNTGNNNQFGGTNVNGGIHNHGGNADADALGVGIGIGVGKASVKNKNTNVGINKNTNVGINKNTNVGINKNTNVGINENTNKNTNLNVNDIDNRDFNVNKQGQVQGQIQGQLQGQVQGQKQTAHNEGVKQNVSITQNYEDKRDHIMGDHAMDQDPELADRKQSKTRMEGKIWEKVDGLTYKQGQMLAKDAEDVVIDEALIIKKDFSTKVVHFGKKGEFMGYLYISAKGTDSNVAAVIGKAIDRASWVGATHVNIIKLDGVVYAGGDSWSVGFGGGASIMASGDKVAIAPNGGTGFGEASAFNVEVPEMTVELYCHEDSLKGNDGERYKKDYIH